MVNNDLVTRNPSTDTSCGHIAPWCLLCNLQSLCYVGNRAPFYFFHAVQDMLNKHWPATPKCFYRHSINVNPSDNSMLYRNFSTRISMLHSLCTLLWLKHRLYIWAENTYDFQPGNDCLDVIDLMATTCLALVHRTSMHNAIRLSVSICPASSSVSGKLFT